MGAKRDVNKIKTTQNMPGQTDSKFKCSQTTQNLRGISNSNTQLYNNIIYNTHWRFERIKRI
jgi:hypothetical protein